MKTTEQIGEFIENYEPTFIQDGEYTDMSVTEAMWAVIEYYLTLD